MKIGINPVGPWFYVTPWIFNDAMKLASCGSSRSNAWGMNTSSGTLSATCDVFGYPVMSSGQSCFTRVRNSIGGHYPSGLYKLSWIGQGTVSLGGDPVLLNQHIDNNSAYYNITNTTDNGIIVYISNSDSLDPVRNVSLIPVNSPNQLYDSTYLDGFKAFPAAIRMSGFSSINNHPISGIIRWQDRVTPYMCSQASHANFVKDVYGNDMIDPETQLHYYTGMGVCLEYQIELCNTLNIPMWCNIPHLASDDYVYGTATMIKNKLNPNLKCYLEYSNEVWNWIYPQTIWCSNLATKAGYSGQTARIGLAMEIKRVYSIFDQVFSDEPDRYCRILSNQVGDGSNFDYIMNMMINHVGYSGIDGFSIAPYFNPSAVARSTYSSGTTTAQILNDCDTFINCTIFNWVQGIKKSANKWSTILGKSILLFGYEFGESLVNPAVSYAKAYYDAQNDPMMISCYNKVMNIMQSGGFQFACHCNDLEINSFHGTFGAREYQDESWHKPKPSVLLNWTLNH